jgi:hypothetical protein
VDWELAQIPRFPSFFMWVGNNPMRLVSAHPYSLSLGTRTRLHCKAKKDRRWWCWMGEEGIFKVSEMRPRLAELPTHV